ncbi:FliM/FliN family flagellar motor C-terminal domain-containing protein [Sulfitobacter sp. HNIBRBA2951]|uniref:FliM/FliN family flagellar motor C-terminal domain-containing protein n=1 Tax=Sulfitobacter aquimarinus TaxID=3158557 RepID=UPI0032DE52B9
MSAEQTTSLVQRKARTGREAYAAREMSLGRALRLTAAKQGEALFDMALAALSITRTSVNGNKLEPLVPEESLLLMLEGRAGQIGAAIMEPALVTGFIQQQTMGNITPVIGTPSQRPNTATDAALCAPFVEALLTRAATLPEDENARELLTGYRFGVWANEPRHVLLGLQAPRYEAIEMTLDMAAGARSGKLLLLLPEPVRIAETEEGADGSEDAAPAPKPTLDKHVMELKAELSIALTRLRLPLQQVTALKVGDVVDLNLSSMAQTLVLDSNGRILSRGTLGQIDGMRALQVEQQKSKLRTEPRRRASDRAELDLPDVGVPTGGGMRQMDALPDMTAMPAFDAMGGDGLEMDVGGGPAFDAGDNIPSMSDVDIFGDLPDLPDLPDIDVASAAADSLMDLPSDDDAEGQFKQAGL